MQTIQTTSAGQRRDAPSLLTVQSQALNLWEEFFLPQEGMTAPPRLKKLPNRPATVTNTGRGYPRANLKQAAGIRVLSLSRPRVCLKARKKTHSQSSPEKDFWYWQPESLTGWDAVTLTEKTKILQERNANGKKHTTRQTETQDRLKHKTVNYPRSRQDPESPLRR